MIFGTLTFRGCRGQPLALVRNIRVKSQMPITPKHAIEEKSTKLLILLPLRTIYNRTFQCETPCTTLFILSAFLFLYLTWLVQFFHNNSKYLLAVMEQVIVLLSFFLLPFLNLLFHPTVFITGRLNSEWIYEFIVSPKIPPKDYRNFCPGSLLRG